MIIEDISENNLEHLVRLSLELWPECSYTEEYDNCRKILNSDKETAFLVKRDDEYVAFVQLSLRTDYVEGASTLPVGYVEGIYVKPESRKHGIAKTLLTQAEAWCLKKDCLELASDTEFHNHLSQKFHNRVGFSESNRIVCYIKKLT